jgi:hypothetical protein
MRSGLRGGIAVAVITASVVAASPAHAAGTRCGTPFRVTRPQGTSTASVAVHDLRQTGTSCRRARDVARIAAKAMLNKGIDGVPATIDGFHMKVPKSCTGCAPQYTVTGRKSGATVRFTLFGGG